MSITTERILIAILLIVAVIFVMRDAHAGLSSVEVLSRLTFP